MQIKKRIDNLWNFFGAIFSATVTPVTDALCDLGSSTLRFRNAYFSGTIYGNIQPTGLASNALVQTNGSGELTASNTVNQQIVCSANINLLNGTPGLNLQPNGTGFFLSLIGATIATANRVITLPDPGQNGNVIYDVLAQTISGLKTFSNGLISFSVTVPSGTPLVLAATGLSSPNNRVTLYENGSLLFATQQTSNEFSWFVSNLVIGSGGSNYCTTNGVLNAINGLVKGTSAIAGTLTLTGSYCGRVLKVSTASSAYIITLPNVSIAIAGYEYYFSIVSTTATGNVTIATNTINGLQGISFVSGSAPSFKYSNQQVAFTQSTLTVGDRALF